METPTPEVIPWGFRGDPFLLHTVDTIIRAGASCFVETGSFHGITLRYMANSYPQLDCHSCELDGPRYQIAAARVADQRNCTVTNEDAAALLGRLAQTPCARQPTLFWLDAHGYGFRWPLRDEVRIITSSWQTAYVIIDDFLVPGRPWFRYDTYDGQVCSLDYIRDSIAPGRTFQLWYPDYPPQIVTSWPPMGWGLLIFDGRADWQPGRYLAPDHG